MYDHQAFLKLKAEMDAAEQRLHREKVLEKDVLSMIDHPAYRAYMEILPRYTATCAEALDHIQQRLDDSFELIERENANIEQRLDDISQAMELVTVEPQPLNLWTLPLAQLDLDAEPKHVHINPARIAAIEPTDWGNTYRVLLGDNTDFWVKADALTLYLDHGVDETRAPGLLVELPDDDDDTPPAAEVELAF